MPTHTHAYTHRVLDVRARASIIAYVRERGYTIFRVFDWFRDLDRPRRVCYSLRPAQQIEENLIMKPGNIGPDEYGT